MISQAQSSPPDRREMQLAMLHRVGQAMTATLDLETLLETIHQQLAQLLQVDNFYVALYDAQEKAIWYPLAVKNGQRRIWPRRPLADRLTDRVILEGQAILLPSRGGERLAEIGLPAGEDAPQAWVGVPLISSQQILGCLAMFSLSPSIEFNEDDLRFLSILSGQISMAVEVALRNTLLAGDLMSGNDRLAAVLNSLDEGIILVEKDGRISLANRAIQEIANLPQPNFIGKSILDLPPSVQRLLGYSGTEADELDDQAGPGKKQYQAGETPAQRFLERTVHPFPSRPDQEPGRLIVLRDLTEEQQARQARELINETLIHDLRSPTSAVLTALDVIEDALGSPEPDNIVVPSLRIARRSAQRILGIIESMLEIARFQAGKVELQLAPCNVYLLVEQTVSEFARQANDYGIALEVNVPKGLHEVLLDENLITRVITNIVDNALKFTPSPGRVRVSAREIGEEWIEVQVSDTGPGIPAEYQEKIFDRFSQIPGQPGRKRGSGLGLAYCRMAVEAHGGHIRVISAPSSGSTFSFSLPIHGNPLGGNSSSAPLTNL